MARDLTAPSMPRRSVLAAGAFAAGLAACSPVKTLNALSPKGGMTITHGLNYGPGPRQQIDVYEPKPARPGAPVVLFFYGGNWDSGARADYAFVGAALARRGYVAMIADYRLYPQVLYPGFLQDCAQAVRWAKDNAAAHGGDPRRLFVMGHSAGAYNAVMMGIDRRWLAGVGLDPAKDLRGVIGLAGPYDFLPLHSAELKIIFGPEAQRPLTQPITYVDGKAPPLWLGVDTGDKVVDPGNTSRLAARIRAMGGQVETREYARLSHQLMIGVIATPLQFIAPVLRDLSVFIHAQDHRGQDHRAAKVGAHAS